LTFRLSTKESVGANLNFIENCGRRNTSVGMEYNFLNRIPFLQVFGTLTHL